MIPPVFSMADSQCNAQQSFPEILCNVVELKKFPSYSSIVNMVDSLCNGQQSIPGVLCNLLEPLLSKLCESMVEP